MTVLSGDRLIEAANALPRLPDTFIQLQILFADPDSKPRDLVREAEACAASMIALQIDEEQVELLLESGSTQLINIQESCS